jgi:hypothetical protein
MKYHFTKTPMGLIPTDPESQEWFNKIKPGQVVSAEFKQIRNYRFLKKWHALLRIGFENWEPGKIDSKYGVPEKSFERFKSDLVILAGYFDTTIRLDGSVRVEPKSVSFAKMSEDDFQLLYSKTIDVLIRYVYGAGMTHDEMDRLVNEYLRFV